LKRKPSRAEGTVSYLRIGAFFESSPTEKKQEEKKAAIWRWGCVFRKRGAEERRHQVTRKKLTLGEDRDRPWRIFTREKNQKRRKR